MPTLQIRDLPAPLHEDLQRRARANKRSLGQQALHDLEQLAGGDAIERRKQVFTLSGTATHLIDAFPRRIDPQ